MSNPKVTKEVRQAVPLPPMELVEVEYHAVASVAICGHTRRLVSVTPVTGVGDNPGVVIEVTSPDVREMPVLDLAMQRPLSPIGLSRPCAEALVLALARFYDLPYTPPEGRK